MAYNNICKELEYQREYRQQNADKCKQAQAKWMSRPENQLRIQESRRKYNENNKDKVKEQQRLYRERNAEILKQKRRERNAAKRLEGGQ